MSTFALAEGLESLLVAQLGFTTFHDESKTRIDGLGILLLQTILGYDGHAVPHHKH